MRPIPALCLLALAVGFAAVPAAASSTPEPLVVATKEAPPFSFRKDGSWRGISIELWERVAEQLGLEYAYREATIEEMLAGLEDGTFDAAVAALTVTPGREERIDFSHPVYASGLGIAVSTSSGKSFAATVLQFFSLGFLKVALGLCALLLVVGLLIWLFERRANPEEFGGSALRGLGSGFWWAAVTMTTVGYGDKAPKTPAGRAVGFVWMFASLIVLGAFIAAFSSAITLNKLSTAVEGGDDLPAVRVGVVAGTTSEEYARAEALRHRSFGDLDEALRALAASGVEAVVYDLPILRYKLRQGEDYANLTTLEDRLTQDRYAIALPPGGELREPLNRLLLRELESPAGQAVFASYLGR